MELPKFVGVKGLTNTGGLAIIAIDHTDDTVEFCVVAGDKVIDTFIKPIVYNNDESDDDCVDSGFEFMGCFQSFNEFMRV